MYKIIGSDLKEYGPSTAGELHQWVREGRADGRTLVRAEGATDWRPLASFPELAIALAGSPLAGTPALIGTGAPLPANVADRDYDLDIWSCIRRAWELMKANFGPMIGISLLVFLAMGGLNQLIDLPARDAMNDAVKGQFTAHGAMLIIVTTLIDMPFRTLFLAGLFRYYLKLIRNEPAEIGDAFSGFTLAPGRLILLAYVQSLLVLAGFCLCLLPGIYLGVAWAFSLILVIDKNLGFWEAMELSRKVVTRHWFIILGLVLVNSLISISGIVACCVGVFVTAPIGLCSLVYAYEDIFGYRPGRVSLGGPGR